MVKRVFAFLIELMWLCGLIFIVLKLVQVIEWNWLIVLSPLWGSFLLLFLIYIIGKVGLWICLQLISRRKR